MKKTVLVTGASGFVGTAFLKRYAQEFNLVPVCLIQTKPEELNFDGVHAVLHLAALVHQMKPVPSSEYFRINTALTEKVAALAKAAGVQHFVFYSTVKVFGCDGLLWDNQKVFTPTSPCIPSDPYGQSKFEAENILSGMANENFKVAVIRPPLVYGEGVKGNMHALVKLLKLSSVLPLGYFFNKRTMVAMPNLLAETAYVLHEGKTGIFIPADSEPVSTGKLVQILATAMGKRVWLLPVPKLFVWVLGLLRPNVAVRLFGSLQFRSEQNLPIERVPMSAAVSEMLAKSQQRAP